MPVHRWQDLRAQRILNEATVALSLGMFFRWAADDAFLVSAGTFCYRKGFNDGLRTGCLLEPEEVPALIDTTVEAMVA